MQKLLSRTSWRVHEECMSAMLRQMATRSVDGMLSAGLGTSLSFSF